jgi:hypothetical protein
MGWMGGESWATCPFQLVLDLSPGVLQLGHEADIQHLLRNESMHPLPHVFVAYSLSTKDNFVFTNTLIKHHVIEVYGGVEI